jgi:hypothetical protein
MRATLVSVRCLVRGLPLFFRATPKTPLRVLGIIAFDTLHMLRHSRPLPRRTIGELAMLLDFEGCANAAWDRKRLDETEYQALRTRLESAGWGTCIETYLGRLRALESTRPSTGGDRRAFDAVRSYREAVIRLSLATAATLALGGAGQGDEDMETLFRILMQCQIIDDVLDYPEDVSAHLPSFLTVSASLPEAMALTDEAARSYATRHGRASGQAVFPLRVALWVFTAATTFVVRRAGRRHRQARGRAS